MKKWMVLSVVLLSVMVFSACSKGKKDVPSGKSGPLVTNVEQKNDGGKISVTVTMQRSQLLGRTFLYGADLQYSSLGDPKYSLLLQSIAIGHFLVEFQIRGDQLVLIAPQKERFESDINHPEDLIASYPIVSLVGDLLTVRMDRASSLVSAVMPELDGDVASASWVRSFEFVAEGNYLLVETTVRDAQGNTAEFMESIFPRETLVPAGYQPLLNDAEREPFADRFRFLGNGKVWMDLPAKNGKTERAHVEAASRYLLKPGQTIDWYVTPNVPDQYLDAVRMGIESWNRYSQAMWKTDMVRFLGRLPEGVKIGDPRYNIVNWDSVAEAGAAYESQAADPLTGIQSHSLVYLPLAWVNIGREYWERGSFSDAHLKKMERLETWRKGKKHFHGRDIRPNCVHDPMMRIHAAGKMDPETFAIELLKGVLMHEIGHALGLAHNFKASLSWDPHDASTAFSTSIMDYNQYQLERSAFESPTSEKGPLLEYDRQILLALYNQGKGLEDAEELSTCNDDEADSEDDGVDPLCIRYDAGNDPAAQLLLARDLITNPEAMSGGQQSLAAAISASVAESQFADPRKVTDITDVMARAKKTATDITGLAQYYASSGAQSLRYMGVVGTRLLRLYQKDMLPEEMSADQIRAKAWEGVRDALGMTVFPKVVNDRIESAIVRTKQWATSTAAFAAVPEADRQKTLEQILKPLSKLLKTLNGVEGPLTRVRTSIAAKLEHKDALPFEVGRSADGAVIADYSSLVPQTLVSMGKEPIGEVRRTEAERALAIQVLKTFKDVEGAKQGLEAIKKQLESELAQETDTRKRMELKRLLAKI